MVKVMLLVVVVALGGLGILAMILDTSLRRLVRVVEVAIAVCLEGVCMLLCAGVRWEALLT